MAIRWRPMRPRDVRECVEIVAAHPVLAPRYGRAIQDLKPVWTGLLGREAFRAIVFEEVRDSSTTLLGCGVSAFVHDEFMQKLKTPPLVWADAELTRRIVAGASPLLSDKEVREANANGGLNLVVWQGVTRLEAFSRPEVNLVGVSAFVEQHRGFLLKEVLVQAIIKEQLLASLNGGALFLNSKACYVDSLDIDPDEALAEPNFYGITRELALSRIGTWIGSIFVYEKPCFNFRPSEQRLLLTALYGGTDEELAHELGISLSAVKKTWRLIYDRASRHLPGFSSNHDGSNGGTDRGKEKKQRLLSYLREHPEELRPASP